MDMKAVEAHSCCAPQVRTGSPTPRTISFLQTAVADRRLELHEEMAATNPVLLTRLSALMTAFFVVPDGGVIAEGEGIEDRTANKKLDAVFLPMLGSNQEGLPAPVSRPSFNPPRVQIHRDKIFSIHSPTDDPRARRRQVC